LYLKVTRDIRIEVEPAYVPDQSNPLSGYYCFSYQVKITNESPYPIQLLSRHWVITDGYGVVHEVKGPGVVGCQPKLAPGESFEYSSFCPLPTPTGNMRGSYHMIDHERKGFDVKIPLFFLRDLRNFH
jgi:ApaG protein